MIPIPVEKPMQTADELDQTIFREEQLLLWDYIKRMQTKARNQQIQREIAIMNNEGCF
jgi:hypothetical protein